jgi:outer membrane assembly lipoprotein YfiO
MLQLQCATKLSTENLKTCLRLLDRLIEDAPDDEFAVKCRKSKADALFNAGKYLEASQEYINFIDAYPNSKLVPEAWFQIAKCHLEQAEWIGRGTQRFKQAYLYFEDFVNNYPNHELTDEAKKTLHGIRAVEAEKYQKIARYYLGPANEPTAALPYLNYIRDSFPGSEAAEWAESQLERLRMERNAPLPNNFERIPLSNTTATLPDSESKK